MKSTIQINKYTIQNYNLCHKFTKMYLFILELFKKSTIQNYNYVIKIIIQTQFMAFYIRNLYKFMPFIYVITILEL